MRDSATLLEQTSIGRLSSSAAKDVSGRSSKVDKPHPQAAEPLAKANDTGARTDGLRGALQFRASPLSQFPSR